MATLAPGTIVKLPAAEREKLRFPPPTASLVIAVHKDALKAPGNRLTQVVGVADDSIVWAGAIDERMVEAVNHRDAINARKLLREHLLVGDALWSVVKPGLLTDQYVNHPLLTVYDGDRPWVVLAGNVYQDQVLAVPLNDSRGNPKWWAPQVDGSHLQFPGSKDSQLELAHLWSIPKDVPRIGDVKLEAQQALAAAIVNYF